MADMEINFKYDFADIIHFHGDIQVTRQDQDEGKLKYSAGTYLVSRCSIVFEI